MDIKFIILLLVTIACVAFVILCMREIDMTRRDMEKSFSDLVNNLDDKVKYLRSKQISDNATIITKLKNENNNLVQQVRKMNMINNQTIRCSNEFMTADTSETSDNGASEKNNKLENNTRENKSKTSVFLSKTSSDGSTHHSTKQTPSVKSTKSGKSENKKELVEEDYVNEELNKLNDNVMEWTVKKNNVSVKVSENSPDEEIEQENNETDNEMNNKSSDSHHSNKSNKSNKSVKSILSKKSKTLEKPSERDESQNSSEVHESDNNSVIEGKIESDGSINIEVDFEKHKKVPINHSFNTKNTPGHTPRNDEESTHSQDKSFSKLKADLDKNSEDSVSNKYKKLLESITIGSQKNKTESDDSSIVSESDTFNSNGSLKNIDKYTVKELRDLAKKYMIPVTVQDDTGKRRSLKKPELYEKILSHLNKTYAEG